MARLSLGLFAVTLLFTPYCFGASASYPERIPAFAKYQNATKCLPLRETWYTVYRNYENDPAFGGTAKCVRISSLGPKVNGSFPMLVQHEKTSMKALNTPSSYGGNNLANIQTFRPVGKNESSTVYVAYVDCQECVLFRNTYVSENACTLLVSKSTLGKSRKGCDFIFDFLCGTAPKYYIYDETCPK